MLACNSLSYITSTAFPKFQDTTSGLMAEFFTYSQPIYFSDIFALAYCLQWRVRTGLSPVSLFTNSNLHVPAIILSILRYHHIKIAFLHFHTMWWLRGSHVRLKPTSLLAIQLRQKHVMLNWHLYMCLHMTVRSYSSLL